MDRSWIPPSGNQVILLTTLTITELSRELRHRRRGRCGDWKFPTNVLVQEVRKRTGKEYV